MWVRGHLEVILGGDGGNLEVKIRRIYGNFILIVYSRAKSEGVKRFFMHDFLSVPKNTWTLWSLFQELLTRFSK